MIIKILILISYVIENIFDFVLVKLNDSYVKKPLPENVKDVYDEEKYKKFRCVKAKEHFKEYVIDKVPEGESVSKALSVRKNSAKAARYSNYYRKEKVIMGELTPGKLAWKNQGHKKGDK